ncbi:MAG: HAD family hydrolase [Planctomycetota bacterium]|jgi:HAD superfamily hydrolase (TIGR01509 family)
MYIKAVIFDLDGTLTQPFFNFDVIREEMGLPKDAGPVLEVMKSMTEQQRRNSEAILHEHEHRAVVESTLNPGTEETLDWLRQSGIHIGILTRNRRENAEAVTNKHNLKFDGIVGRDEGPVKPDSFGVLHLCRKFEVTPQETMVVGDYLFDILCAKSAGAVAVLLKNQERAEEFAQQADFSIDSVDQIMDIIKDKQSGV